MKIDRKLTDKLMEDVLDGTEHPAEAVTALMSCAATILARNFGEAGALEIMAHTIDQSMAAQRAVARSAAN